MFKIGEYAVCPGHGVGQLISVEDRDMGGEVMSFYVLKVVANGMTVMVPTNKVDGIRGLVSESEINEVYELLKEHDIKIDNSTWNRRSREYLGKIKTGSLLEIAEVLRALFLLKETKNLSFGEKKMLDQCKELIAEEISLSKGGDSGEIKGSIDSCFQ